MNVHDLMRLFYSSVHDFGFYEILTKDPPNVPYNVHELGYTVPAAARSLAFHASGRWGCAQRRPAISPPAGAPPGSLAVHPPAADFHVAYVDQHRMPTLSETGILWVLGQLPHRASSRSTEWPCDF